MPKYSYINCPYCNFFFKFKNEKPEEDEGSLILTCPSCNMKFGITEGPPLHLNNFIENPINLFGGVTAPVDSEPLFQDVGLPIIDVDDSEVDTLLETTDDSIS